MSQNLPEKLPDGKAVVVTNLANSRTIITLQTSKQGGKAFSTERLVLGRSADEKEKDEPPSIVRLEPKDAAVWWPNLLRFAKDSEHFPAAIALSIG